MRQRAPLIAAFTLLIYLLPLLPRSTAWAQTPHTAAMGSSAQGEFNDETQAALEAHLAAQATASETAAGNASGVSEPEVGSLAPPGAAPTAPAAPSGPAPSSPRSPLETTQATERVSPQAISLPSGAATTAGLGESFTAQLTTGVAAFSVPLSVPRGRAGVAPALGLVYASSNGYGVAGVGWSLAGPVAIARQSDRGLPGYDDRGDWHPQQDRFTFGGQELVPVCTVSGGQCTGALAQEEFPAWSDGWQYFRARVEGAFLRFFWSPDQRTWRIQSKAGTSFELGAPLDGSGYEGGLERNPDAPRELYRWHVVRQYDAHGTPDAATPAPNNLILFRYFHDQGVAYLSDLFYTPPVSAPGTLDLARFAHHVAFTYDSRPDRSSSYRSGWLLEQRLRLTRVDVTSKPFDDGSAARELVRRYHLEYDPATHASLLASVSVEGRCSSAVLEQSDLLLPPSSCARLPSLSFEYQRVTGSDTPLLDSQGFELERFATALREVDASPPHSLASKSSLSALIDVDSDGLADVVATQPALLGGNHQVFFNQGERNGRLSFAPARSMAVTGIAGVDASVLNLGSSNVAVLDVDGDASADLVHMPMQRRYSVFRSVQQGNQWLWLGRSIATASGQDVKIDFARDARRTAIMDVNGDGLVDVVFASATEYQTFFSLGRYPGGDGQFGHARWTGPASAELSNEPVTACVPWSAEPVRLGDPDVRIGDVNGDGLPDIVRFRPGQVFYWPGRGDGTWGTGDRTDCRAGDLAQERHIPMGNAPRFGTAQAGSVQLGDVNGDGLADVVEVRADAVDVYLNDNALAFTDRRTLRDVPFRSNLESPVRLIDINGSGSVDLLWGQGHEYRYVDLTGGVRPYLLTQVHNGLGKSTQLEYRSSTDLMVEADDAGEPWATVMPLSTPLVVRATVHDHLQTVGRAAGHYVTEYSYRDPVFEARQREFRGFRTAETRQLGDLSSPTSIVRSTHLLGECEVAQNGFDVCSPTDRWRDNWREPLKGLPVLTETFDEAGVYLATEHSSYELRQLYMGRDGRRVSVTFPTGKNVFRYDTHGFNGASANVSLPALDIDLDGITQSESRLVPRRATAGTARLRSTSVHDDFGNLLSSTAFGCVEGCPQVDEAITVHRTTARVPGDTSGWLWRPTEGFVTGSLQTAQRQRVRHEYSARGDLQRSLATLSGTLPLDRFHESALTVAPAPPNASGGVATPVEIQVAAYDHDPFGNVSATRAPHGRCSSMQLDGDYAELPVTETAYGGDVGSSGCGERSFVTQATYDRGLSQVLTTTSITGQPAQFDYDGFGRLVAETYADPEQPGLLAAVPSVTYQYLLPSDWHATPYSILLVRSQDGATPNHHAYHERYSYTDGLGRALVAISEADPSAGDGGQYVAGGVTHYTAKGEPLRAFENRFWSGNPLASPPGDVPGLRYVSWLYDPFNRVIRAEGFDRAADIENVHHALSIDRWDTADLHSVEHAGSFATARMDGHGRQVEAIERVGVGGVLEQRRLLSEYLPTGELRRTIQRRAGSADVVRWLRYDSLGRLVLNVEPNTSAGFNPDPNTDPGALEAWRYAYDDAGRLVGTSDARGCGVNYHYDAAGRLLAEDYSPCLDHHAPYSSPNFSAHTGLETFYRYDTADPQTGAIEDAAGRTLPINSSLLWGRLASAADLGTKSVVSYDARGRVKGIAERIVKPGAPAPALADRYAPRWYLRETVLDAADRVRQSSTGASSPELLDSNDQSVVARSYSRRGLLVGTTSSYGTLLASRSVDANGLLTALTLGDAAQTQRLFAYNESLRLQSVQTFRGTPQLWSSPPGSYTPPGGAEPTDQLLLEDYDFEYDAVDNITQITDWRIPGEWPQSAQPVTRHFEYDDSYRLTHTTYEYPGGTDTWSSPFAPENASSSSVAEEPEPSPHVDFSQRILEQTYAYDHLGNTQQTTDNAHGFFDRSLGTISHGSTSTGPHQLQAASNRTLAPSSPRRGDLNAAYDDAGNLTDLIVRRDGPCLPAGASCWQRYHYEWDELGFLSRARRYDLTGGSPTNERGNHGDLSDPLPARSADVQLRYTYAAGGDRVLKTAADPAGNERHTVYVFSSLELRRTTFDGVDYVLSPITENVRLDGGVSARVVYSEEDLPALMSGGRHLFLMLSDQIGSNTFIIDHATGELVEYATYQAYGSTESNYRPERWGSFREAYKFSGKEEDVEVGLAYFEARYLSLGLGRWMSADPAAVHGLRILNPYSYVEGRPLAAVDPTGTEPITLGAIALGVAIGAAIGGATAGAAYTATNSGNFNLKDFGMAVGIGALSGGVAGGVGGIATGLAGGGIAVAAGSTSYLGGAGLGAGTAAVIGGAAGSAAGSVAGALASGQDINGGSIVLSASLGAASAGVFHYLQSPTEHYSAAFDDLDAAKAHRDMAITRLSAAGRVKEYSSVVYEYDGNFHYSEPLTIHDVSLSQGVMETIEAGTIPEGAEIVNYGHTHPAYRDDPRPGGWHSGDYQTDVTGYLEAAKLEDYTISQDYTSTTLNQSPDPPKFSSSGSGHWDAHTLRIAEMSRAGYGRVPQGDWHLGKTSDIPRRFIVEGAR